MHLLSHPILRNISLDIILIFNGFTLKSFDQKHELIKKKIGFIYFPTRRHKSFFVVTNVQAKNNL
jgi:hypothetical protein